MPPKENTSKKAQKKKVDQAIEDRTFGLKNKNKSKKIQDFITGVEKTVKNSAKSADAEKIKEAKKNEKIAKQLAEEELRTLFNEGITGQFGKKKSKASADAKAMGIAEANQEVLQLIEDIGSDDDDSIDDNIPGLSSINDNQVTDISTTIEVFKERTIEDIIEEQRAKLLAEGKKGTPVTAESFAKWRAEKLLKRQQEAEARVKAEQSKKKGGKGLSVLSGKELFNYNSALFVDDDAAIDASEELALSSETRAREDEEEKQANLDAERAQVEQLRLAEIERLNQEELLRKHQLRQQKALANSLRFELDSILINEAVFEFEVDEGIIEDLTPFPVDQDGNEILPNAFNPTSINEELFAAGDDDDLDLLEEEDCCEEGDENNEDNEENNFNSNNGDDDSENINSG